MVPMFDNLQISIAWTMLLVMAYTCTQKNEIFMNAEIDITKIVFVTLCEW